MFSRLLSIALLAAACSLPAATLDFLGDLSNTDPTFNRPSGTLVLSGVGTNVFYDFYTFTVNGVGVVRLETMSGAAAPALADSTLSLYSGSFNPASPLTNIVAYNDDGGGNPPLSRMDPNLAPGTYVAVVSSFANGDTGDYHLQIEGDVSASGVPEPSTALLSLAGLAVAAAWKRNARRS